MITINGKEIIAKFLLGQVPAYATHVAIGCGEKPLLTSENPTVDPKNRNSLAFEMIRQPIVSKGFVDEKYGPWTPSAISLTDNVISLTIAAASYDGSLSIGDKIQINVNDSNISSANKLIYNQIHVIKDIDVSTDIVFTFDYINANIGSVVLNDGLNEFYGIKTKISLVAEMPTANRYEITEVGVWSAGTNSIAGNSDSRHIFNFSDGWERHGYIGTTIQNLPIPTVQKIGLSTTTGAIDTTESIFYANTNDPSFHTSSRRLRKEGPRFLNTTVVMRGDTTSLSGSYPNQYPNESLSSHIHFNGVNLGTEYNSPNDKLTLAYSLISKSALDPTPPTGRVQIFVEFYQNEYNLTTGYAKWHITKQVGDFASSFYQVDSITLGDLGTSPNSMASDFSPSKIRVCRIFVNIDDTDPTNFYIAFDGLRLDNVTTYNPVHQLTGYSVVKNENAYPIVKNANSKSYIEFRFALGMT